MSKTSFDPRASSFPCSLHMCLSEIDAMASNGEDSKGFKKIFRWQTDGLSFKVFNREKFQELIMPIYFPKIKYNSFVRQLTMYGFKKCENSGERRGGKHASTVTYHFPSVIANRFSHLIA